MGVLPDKSSDIWGLYDGPRFWKRPHNYQHNLEVLLKRKLVEFQYTGELTMDGIRQV